ncbi:hypothetical protein [Pedobacter sp. ASV28]|uniref:hypothetical protein n=1 Tax=Pedobacter sp. ASV28 TaxID=2795123 RepID=UPI0018EB42B4|nr:hypothetical protein [Pedobacter sp. ASV28]
MKYILSMVIMALMSSSAISQTKINKSYPVKNGQEIELKFDYPKLIKISTWDKNEVSISASVKINDGDSDDRFILKDTIIDGKLSIKNKIDWDNIPEIYYIQEQGVKTRFNSKQDLENYKKEKGTSLQNVSIYQQKNAEITMEIKVPANIITAITSIYGMIELVDFNGEAKIDAKYGGVDASLDEAKIGKIKLTNRYGNIYSNLKLTPTEKTEKNFYTSLTAEPGKGPSYDISSSYGNIYLRRKP